MKPAILAAALALLTCAPAFADKSPGPQPAPMPPPIPPPRDEAYPGAIRLDVDATDLAHHVFSIRETIPAAGAGDLVLLYPKWLPGAHGPRGAIDKIGGLTVRADGRTLPWTRDPVDSYAFHVAVPGGVSAIEVAFQFLSATEAEQGRIVMTPDMLNLQWISTVLYPAGTFARRIQIEPRLTLPGGWRFATALRTVETTGATTRFAPVDLETFVDSPLYAGRNFRRFDLDPGAEPQVHLDVFADRPDELEASPAQIDAHKALAAQIRRLFGSAHFDHYDLLLSLSDQMSFNGLEHLRSSENGTPGDYFTEWDKNPALRDLLPHEWTHSWNGKFRRPADLWAANLNEPERDSLLWVYEGQTQYWGRVLAARSGLWTKAQALDALALDAARMEEEAGRAWRPLADTTNDPIFKLRRPEPWPTWQRGEDYYTEGLLIWLEADGLIRQESGGSRSMDDFARAFFGVQDGAAGPLTYTFEDVVRALNGVQPYDWAGFLRDRLERTGPRAPLGGLTRGGYVLVFDETPNAIDKSWESQNKSTDLSFSIGLALGPNGMVRSVAWDGPAFRAGLAGGSQIVAVDGIAYGDGDDLKRAIRLAKGGGAPIELLVKSGKQFSTLRVDYHEGLRYPHLSRIPNAPALIDDIIAPAK